MASDFYRLFPADRRGLLGSVTGNSIMAGMAEREFRELIVSCLTGSNPRIYTETWAVSKVFLGVFTGIQQMFEAGKRDDPDFVLDAPIRAAAALRAHHTAARRAAARLQTEDRVLCEWICNLTGKGWDNILQANPDNLTAWADSLRDAVQAYAHGDAESHIVNMTLYNASLSKKGGLKSAMGNLFESLLLFSGLSACGLPYVREPDAFSACRTLAFTLDTNEGRQSDAQIRTGLAQPADVFIDIGFIGKGNPEIIADKTQRFGNLEGGGAAPLEGTLVIVSAVPETEEAQLVVRQAQLLGAVVITMSGNNWVAELSQSLRDLGLPGVREFPEDVGETRAMLDAVLPASAEICRQVPKRLEPPPHWG